jgi:hypothetical protein
MVLLAAPAMSSVASAQSATLFAILNGASECTSATPPACGQGDPDGVGSANVILMGATSLCATIIVDNIGVPTGAHIHAGGTGVNGAISLPLTTPTSGNPGASTFCTTVAPAGLTTSLRNSPQKFYINVHTGAFPSGAVRGQLF